MKNIFLLLLLNLTGTFFLFGQHNTPDDHQRKAITSLIDQYSEAREKRDTILLKKHPDYRCGSIGFNRWMANRHRCLSARNAEKLGQQPGHPKPSDWKYKNVQSNYCHRWLQIRNTKFRWHHTKNVEYFSCCCRKEYMENKCHPEYDAC